jgi:AraC-like DNA-binding protein
MADIEARRFVACRIRNCILNILRQIEEGNEGECLGNVHFRLEWLLDIVMRYYQTDLIEREIVNLLHDALRNLTNVQDTAENNYEAEAIFTGNRGRPSYNIPYEQVTFLAERRFTIKQMAAILGVSERTVQRRLRHFGLSIRGTYTNLSDQDLDTAVQEILNIQPHTGNKRMTGYLAARGFRVQQQRIRESMRRVDPEGTLMRALELNVINRRRYSVPSPLALWHIDGNHKLIR